MAYEGGWGKNRGACGNGGGAKNKLKVQEARKRQGQKGNNAYWGCGLSKRRGYRSKLNEMETVPNQTQIGEDDHLTLISLLLKIEERDPHLHSRLEPKTSPNPINAAPIPADQGRRRRPPLTGDTPLFSFPPTREIGAALIPFTTSTSHLPKTAVSGSSRRWRPHPRQRPLAPILSHTKEKHARTAVPAITIGSTTITRPRSSIHGSESRAASPPTRVSAPLFVCVLWLDVADWKKWNRNIRHWNGVLGWVLVLCSFTLGFFCADLWWRWWWKNEGENIGLESVIENEGRDGFWLVCWWMWLWGKVNKGWIFDGDGKTVRRWICWVNQPEDEVFFFLSCREHYKKTSPWVKKMKVLNEGISYGICCVSFPFLSHLETWDKVESRCCFLLLPSSAIMTMTS